MYSTEQILSLAPNENNASRGKALAKTRHWTLLATDGNALWGLCNGSGKKPYQTAIHLNGPAFTCSCPSRQFPCKHAIGLLLLYSSGGSSFQQADQPDWVNNWINARKEKAGTAAPAAPPTRQNDRIRKRIQKLDAELPGLKQWLEDIMRVGYGSTDIQQPAFWEEQAARMVDAKASGIASMLREIPELFYRDNWITLLSARLADINLLVNALLNRDQLSEPVQQEILARVGITPKKEEVLAGKGVQDTWQVLGLSERFSQRLYARRTWLLGKTSRKFALILDFAFGEPNYERKFLAGTEFNAQLVYYPSAVPQRALIKSEPDNLQKITTINSSGSLEGFLDEYASYVARQPFNSVVPLLLTHVNVIVTEGEGCMTDQHNCVIPVTLANDRYWQMLAVSGGKPCTVFGEWNGATWQPLTLIVNHQFYHL